MFRPKRNAFTLTELAVTTALFSVMLGLTFLGIQEARDAARRVSEMNDLKNIGLAAHGYAAANGDKFPSAIRADPQTGQLVPGTVWLLPFMGEQGFYEAWDRNKSPNEQPELGKIVPAYSNYEGSPDLSSATIPGNREPVGLSFQWVGGNGIDGWNLPPSDPGAINANGIFHRTNGGLNGLMPPHEQVKMSDVPAGLTHVALAIQHTGPNDIYHRPYFNPHNQVINSADQGGHTRHKSAWEISPTTFFVGLNPHYNPNDVAFLNSWTVTSLGVGKIGTASEPLTVAQAYRGHSVHRDPTIVCMGDGRIISFEPAAAGTTGEQTGLELFRKLGNRHRGAPDLGK